MRDQRDVTVEEHYTSQCSGVVIELEESEYTFSEKDGAVPVCAVLHGGWVD